MISLEPPAGGGRREGRRLDRQPLRGYFSFFRTRPSIAETSHMVAPELLGTPNQDIGGID